VCSHAPLHKVCLVTQLHDRTVHSMAQHSTTRLSMHCGNSKTARHSAVLGGLRAEHTAAGHPQLRCPAVVCHAAVCETLPCSWRACSHTDASHSTARHSAVLEVCRQSTAATFRFVLPRSAIAAVLYYAAVCVFSGFIQRRQVPWTCQRTLTDRCTTQHNMLMLVPCICL
jgi:hypothetical protein